MKSKILIGILFICLGCCKDNSNNDYKPLVNNKNTWSKSSCYVNDTLWEDCKHSMFGGKESYCQIYWDISSTDKSLLNIFLSDNCSNQNTSVAMYLRDFNDTGRYQITLPNKALFAKYLYDGRFDKFYISNNINTGEVHVSNIKKVKNSNTQFLLSGTFNFIVMDSTNTDTIKITDGKFTDILTYLQ